MTLSQSFQSCIDSARQFQTALLKRFGSRSNTALQLVEALAHAATPTSVVELSQETPFQRSYSTINKVLNEFGVKSLVRTKVNEGGVVKTVESIDPELFSKITKPFSALFIEMLPQEVNRRFRLFALDVTPIPRLYAHTIDDRSYVHQSNQLGIPITIGVQVSVLVYLPERSEEEANWQLPLILERVSTNATACGVASTQLQLLTELNCTDPLLSVIVADTAYGSLQPYSDDQVVIARGRADRHGRRPLNKDNQILCNRKGRPRKYEPGLIRFIDDLPPGAEGGSDEEYEYTDLIKKQPVDLLLNRWNDVHVTGHSELVDVVKVEVFAANDCTKALFPSLLLILSGKRRREITALDAFKSYRCRFDIEHFFRFSKQKLLFSAYQTPDLDHQISWWWFSFMAYWLLYHVRHAAQGGTRPWHKTKELAGPAGPGKVKRLFAIKIFPSLGSPSLPPINRRKSQGRQLGAYLTKRERKKVVKKRKKRQKAA